MMSMQRPERIAEGLDRLIAPNPSPLTERGTNTWILGRAALVVIDPGPDIDRHLEALLCAFQARSVSHILVTHAHRDHSALAPRLARETGAPVLAFGDAFTGRSAVMSEMPDIGGGEGRDIGFRPDLELADGDLLTGPDWRIEAIHTPGHFGNHLSFQWQDAIFTGDVVMGWSTSLVSPPDGDMGAFFRSCARLADRRASVLYPGHGDPVSDPAARLGELIEHRRARERQILNELRTTNRALTAAVLAQRIYTDIDPEILPAAGRNVLAHLIDLSQRGMAEPRGSYAANTSFVAT